MAIGDTVTCDVNKAMNLIESRYAIAMKYELINSVSTMYMHMSLVGINLLTSLSFVSFSIFYPSLHLRFPLSSLSLSRLPLSLSLSHSLSLSLQYSAVSSSVHSFDHCFSVTTSSTLNIPTIILYGEIGTPQFVSAFNNLWSKIQSSGIRICLRHWVAIEPQERVRLSGYGVQLAVKSTEYKAVDDTKVKEG